MSTASIFLSLKSITCCHDGCGITWGVPEDWHDHKVRNHSAFYCPNGHRQGFIGETEEERLKKQLTRERAEHDQTKADRAAWKNIANDTEKVLEKVKAKEKRGRMLARNGMCPCCRRHFKALAAHMRTKHPAYGVKA